jgi:hypothetical protein
LIPISQESEARKQEEKKSLVVLKKKKLGGCGIKERRYNLGWKFDLKVSLP